MIKSNRKNVLTILCVEKGAQNQRKAWKDNLENMTFVEITEKAMFKAEAEAFLLNLAKKDGIKDLQGLTIEEDKGYSRSDLESIYSDWYAAYQKNIEFPEYKNFAVLECKPEQKVEGTAYSRLQNMIGLSGVKGQIENIISFARLEKLKKDAGLCCGSVSSHMVFSGNPGTAKTTVARLFAQIMKDNDLLMTGKFVETGRADLVDRYVGGTAPRVRDKFKEARGGILFIDEAYSILDGREGLYGDEAINTIVQEMENNRDNTIVIFAGYKKEMEAFIERNSGLKSRVAHFVDFPDYDAEELTRILELLAKEQQLTLTEGRDRVLEIMQKAVKTENFGNGRFARNLLDAARLRQAGRIAKMEKPDKNNLITLTAADFETPQFFGTEKRTIGFID